MGNRIHIQHQYLFPNKMLTIPADDANAPNATNAANVTNITVCDPIIDPEHEIQEMIRQQFPDINRIILLNFVTCTIFIGTICVIGLIGNTLSIIVLRKDRSRSTTNFVLQVLAVADTLLLLACFLYLSLQPVYYYTGKLESYNAVYYYLLPYLLPFAIMAQTITNWLVVVVTVERYIVVCWPFKASRWCTLPKVKRAVVLIILLGVLYNIPRFFEWDVSIQKDICTNYTYTQPAQNPLRTHLVYKIVYRVLSYFIFVAVGPIIILTGLNFKLISALRKATKERIALTGGASQTQTNNTTIIVVVVTVFIICQTPALIHQIMEANDVNVDSSISSYSTPLSNMLVTFNSSTNFFIYCLFGQKFRRIFLRMICNQKRAASAHGFQSTTTNNTSSMYNAAKLTTVTQITVQHHQNHHDNHNHHKQQYKNTEFI